MRLPDVNVLLAGFRVDHVHHGLAYEFLEEARSGNQPLGLSDFALTSVLRMATNSRVFIEPDSADAVIEYIDVLLEAPGELLRTGSTHFSRFTALCRSLQLRGNLIPDAYLAALAFEQGAELVTFDRGFGRYPGLRWRCLLDSQDL